MLPAMQFLEPPRGSPIDFGRQTVPARRRHDANPLIWGARGGIIAALIGTVASFAGQLEPSQTVIGFAAGGFFWMEIVARIWNRLGHRKVISTWRRDAES